MKWQDAKASIDRRFDCDREACYAKFELIKRMRDVLLNEEGTQQEILKKVEQAQTEILALRDEESFRKYLEDRANWDPFYESYLMLINVDKTPLPE